MPAAPRLRPMRSDDAPAVHEVAMAAFADLAARLGRAPEPPADPAAAHARIRHLVRTDPEGAWVAEDAGGVAAGALAIEREGVWGLSLLVAHPRAQSEGVGRALLARALEHGRDARGGIILASDDPRALRAYARAGFALHPSAKASGVPRPLARPAEVRDGSPGDLPLCVAIDCVARGAAHGADITVLLASGARLLLVEDRAYAVVRGGVVRLLAARDVASAQAVLRGALAACPPGESAVVDWLTARQDWAVEVVLEAGLELRVGGAVFVRGDVGPFRPYIPSGAYL